MNKQKTCTLLWWGSITAHTRTASGWDGWGFVSMSVQEGTSYLGCEMSGEWIPNPSPSPPPLYHYSPGLQGWVQWPQLSAPSPGRRSIGLACRAWSSFRSTCPFISEEEGSGEEEEQEKGRGMSATCPSFTWMASGALHMSPCNVSDWLFSSMSFLLQQTGGEEWGTSMSAELSPDKTEKESHDTSSSSGWSSCQLSSCSSCSKVQKPFVTTPGRWSSKAPMWGWANCCQAWRVAEPGG